MWLTAIRVVAANLLVIVSLLGFGSLVSHWFPESFSRPTRLVCVLIGGFGVLGIILFIVGHIAFSRLTIGLVFLVGLVLAGFSAIRLWDIRVAVARLPASIVGIMLIVTALSGLAEPVGDWNIDTVTYHLVGPKVWLRNGIIRPIPDNMPTSYPCTAEMVFASLYAFGGDRAPGFSAAWTLGLLLAIAALLGRRCGLDTTGAWWVAALIVVMPAVYQGSVSGFIDAIYAGFILAAVRIGLDAREQKHFLAFGLFCGLAMATKYPGLIALPALVLCAALRKTKQDSFRKMIPNAALATVVACIVASPIYLKNWFLLGSPIYPPPEWVTHYLHVKYFPVEAMREFYAYNIRRGNGHGRGILHFFTLPFNLTYHSADFSGGGGIGLAPLAFGPLGIVASRCAPFARRLSMVALLLLFLWFVTMQEARYLIHFFALAAVFASLGWRYANSLVGGRGKLVCATAVAISLAYGVFIIGKSQIPALRSVFSSEVARERRQKLVPFVESFDFVNHDPLVTRLLILDPSVPPYYSDKDYIKPFGQWGELVYPDVLTPAEILPKVAELHVSHVLDVQSPVSDFRVPQNYPGLVMVFERPDQRIYKIVRQD